MAKDKKDMSTEELIELTEKLFEEEKHDDVIKLLDNTTLENSKSDELYIWKAVAYNRRKEHDKAIKDYTKAIKLNPDYALAYNNRAGSWYDKGEYDRAIKDYTRALALNSNFETAKLWLEKAKEKLDEQRALEGQSFEIDEENTSTAIQLFARILRRFGVKKEDISDIMKTSAEVKTLGVDSIRNLAADNVQSVVTNNLVAHYTKLSVAEIIVSTEDSKHRFYNAVYMNDPEEGRVLLDYISPQIKKCFEAASIEEEDNIYIGSYLPAPEHEDELVMWRTYGKNSDQEEAKGCSIVIDTKFFDTFNKKGTNSFHPEMSIVSDTNNASTKQSLYRVLYYDRRKKSFVCDNEKELKSHLKLLNNKLLELKKLKIINPKKTDDYAYNKNKAIDKIIYHLISEVRFFFKRSDYAFENEVRVIQFATKGSELLEIDTNSKPPRVYLDSKKDVKPYIRKIILDPKVPNPKQWFFLEVAMKKYKGEGHENGYDIQVVPSKRKYQ